MAFGNSQEKFIYELGDIYDAEQQFLAGQQEMLQHASNPQLQQGLQEHIQQTQQHIQNLDQVFSLLGQQSGGNTCAVAQCLVSDAQQLIGMAQSAELTDCVIDGAAATVEHFEIASYRGLLTVAQAMGQDQIVSLLQQNLQQEEQTAQKLESLAPQLVQQAMQAEGTQPKMGGTASGDPYVQVNTAGASDILIDNTQSTR
jgi:ferritin-like metal-binding protein YciE